MKCTNCGNEIPGVMKFCPYCGVSRDESAGAGAASHGDPWKNVYDAPSVPADELTGGGGLIVCGNCGSPLEYGDAFCCVCGTPVSWDGIDGRRSYDPAKAAPERWNPADDDDEEITVAIKYGKESGDKGDDATVLLGDDTEKLPEPPAEDIRRAYSAPAPGSPEEPPKLRGSLAGGRTSSAGGADIDDGEFFSNPGDLG